MKTSFVRTTMKDGSQWDVPAFIIAQDRARHYEVIHADEGDHEHHYNEGMEDEDLLLDWASNSMNWVDVSKYATKFKEADGINLQEGWVNGKKELIGR